MLWKKKIKIYNVDSEKFATTKFLNFVKVDSRPIMDQMHEQQLIFQDITYEVMNLCEMFTVNCFIDKLLSNWKDFKNYLIYK